LKADLIILLIITTIFLVIFKHVIILFNNQLFPILYFPVKEIISIVDPINVSLFFEKKSTKINFDFSGI
jgi:hypothetical protein